MNPEKELFRIPSPKVELHQKEGISVQDLAKSCTIPGSAVAKELLEEGVVERMIELGLEMCLDVNPERTGGKPLPSTRDVEDLLAVVSDMRLVLQKVEEEKIRAEVVGEKPGKIEGTRLSNTGAVLNTAAALYLLDIIKDKVSDGKKSSVEEYLRFLCNREAPVKLSTTIELFAEKVSTLEQRFLECQQLAEELRLQRDQAVKEAEGSMVKEEAIPLTKSQLSLIIKNAIKENEASKVYTEEPKPSVDIAPISEVEGQMLIDGGEWKSAHQWWCSVYPESLNPRKLRPGDLGAEISEFLKLAGLQDQIKSIKDRNGKRVNIYHRDGIKRFLEERRGCTFSHKNNLLPRQEKTKGYGIFQDEPEVRRVSQPYQENHITNC